MLFYEMQDGIYICSFFVFTVFEDLPKCLQEKPEDVV